MIVKRVDELKRLVALVPEGGVDLLNLFRLIQPGDVILSETSREVKKERAYGRWDSERVSVTLGVEVGKKLIDPLMRRIGFAGRIVYESRQLDLIGKHHTIHVHPGMEVRVRSEKGFERLKAFASNYLGRKGEGERVLCVALDNEGLAVAEFTGHGLKTLYSKRIPSLDKSVQVVGDGEREKRFREVAGLLHDYLREHEGAEIVLLGPSIFVEDFVHHLKRERKEILGRVGKRGYVSLGREEGLQEALRSGVLAEYGSSLKPVGDAVEVERFVRIMSENPEMVALGLKEVLEAWRLGAIEKVLASEGFLWERIVDENVAGLLDEVERGRIKLRVILDGLEASEKIKGLGGIVAFLRYPLRLRG